MDGTEDRVLARGVLRLDPAAPPFQGARAIVRLRDTTYADAPARPLAEQVLEGIRHDRGAAEELPFTLRGPSPPPEARDARVSAHVDVDGDGRISPGDLVSEQSYPAPLAGAANGQEPPLIAVEVVLYPMDAKAPAGE